MHDTSARYVYLYQIRTYLMTDHVVQLSYHEPIFTQCDTYCQDEDYHLLSTGVIFFNFLVINNNHKYFINDDN